MQFLFLIRTTLATTPSGLTPRDDDAGYEDSLLDQPLFVKTEPTFSDDVIHPSVDSDSDVILVEYSTVKPEGNSRLANGAASDSNSVAAEMRNLKIDDSPRASRHDAFSTQAPSTSYADVPSTSYADVPSTSYADVPSTSYADLPSTSGTANRRTLRPHTRRASGNTPIMTTDSSHRSPGHSKRRIEVVCIDDDDDDVIVCTPMKRLSLDPSVAEKVAIEKCREFLLYKNMKEQLAKLVSADDYDQLLRKELVDYHVRRFTALQAFSRRYENIKEHLSCKTATETVGNILGMSNEEIGYLLSFWKQHELSNPGKASQMARFFYSEALQSNIFRERMLLHFLLCPSTQAANNKIAEMLSHDGDMEYLSAFLFQANIHAPYLRQGFVKVAKSCGFTSKTRNALLGARKLFGIPATTRELISAFFSPEYKERTAKAIEETSEDYVSQEEINKASISEKDERLSLNKHLFDHFSSSEEDGDILTASPTDYTGCSILEVPAGFLLPESSLSLLGESAALLLYDRSFLPPRRFTDGAPNLPTAARGVEGTETDESCCFHCLEVCTGSINDCTTSLENNQACRICKDKVPHMVPQGGLEFTELSLKSHSDRFNAVIDENSQETRIRNILPNHATMGPGVIEKSCEALRKYVASLLQNYEKNTVKNETLKSFLWHCFDPSTSSWKGHSTMSKSADQTMDEVYKIIKDDEKLGSLLGLDYLEIFSALVLLFRKIKDEEGNLNNVGEKMSDIFTRVLQVTPYKNWERYSFYEIVELGILTGMPELSLRFIKCNNARRTANNENMLPEMHAGILLSTHSADLLDIFKSAQMGKITQADVDKLCGSIERSELLAVNVPLKAVLLGYLRDLPSGGIGNLGMAVRQYYPGKNALKRIIKILTGG